jgi:hypothetical protein
MNNKMALLFLATVAGNCQAQPFIDIVSAQLANSPPKGFWHQKNTGNHFTQYAVNTNIPVVVKKQAATIVFSPSFEQWNIQINGITSLPSVLQSLALPVTVIKTLSPKWSLTVSALPRWNGYTQRLFQNSFQLGFATLLSVKQRPSVTYKWGLYYNSEFSGTFIMPLLGIDWQINKKNRLFGVLPGEMNLEHRLSNRFYWGGSFKAITNTYRVGAVNNANMPEFARIDDNQLLLFADYYGTKNIVFTLKAGHSVFRRLRLGAENASAKYYYREKMNDNLVVKLSMAYRVQLR